MEPLMEPAKVKAQGAYDVASDHFDDVPRGFWEPSGCQTAAWLALP
jgi:hypothetical protein